MADQYDPRHAPDPADWLAMEEFERLELVRSAHRGTELAPAVERIHSATHMVVENQVALGDETPVQKTVQRLMTEGLDRHQAVHAVGTVVMQHIIGLMQSDDPVVEDPNLAYYAELRRLTAASWIEEYGGN